MTHITFRIGDLVQYRSSVMNHGVCIPSVVNLNPTDFDHMPGIIWRIVEFDDNLDILAERTHVTFCVSSTNHYFDFSNVPETYAACVYFPLGHAFHSMKYMDFNQLNQLP